MSGEACGCIFVYDDDEGDAGVCDCDCRSTIVIHSPVLSARIAVNTDDIELAQLAAFLNARCEVDVLVPEKREREKVWLHMRDSTLTEVIEAAGLTTRDSGPPESGSALPYH